jgi:UDP-glucose:tetrahydrobiopterin glucosyltransferase
VKLNKEDVAIARSLILAGFRSTFFTIIMKNLLNILVLSTPVGAIGSGKAGGVELTIKNIVNNLSARGHGIDVVAPAGSEISCRDLHLIEGNFSALAQDDTEQSTVVIPDNSVLENMWDFANEVQHDYDLLVNFAYDWLPLYLTPFFDRPIAHWISMSCISPMMNRMVSQTTSMFPQTLAVNTRVSANTFQAKEELLVMGKGINLQQYTFVEKPQTPNLAWAGRISPEKGLADAIEAAMLAERKLDIFGVVQNPDYWQAIQNKYPASAYNYHGFLATADFQAKLGNCVGLLMTSHWIEAFGNVVIEALACGVPVVAYNQGGPAEIIENGLTGWLVEHKSIVALSKGLQKIEQIDRYSCRLSVERKFSLSAFADRIEFWFQDVSQSKLANKK